mmetsp:Transcript_1627/g.4095  ORF Transcript_1627/g.4095 Transcript_1627/m.4095 type:complete len:372 (-) Transcript_1627:772-1887(-)
MLDSLATACMPSLMLAEALCSAALSLSSSPCRRSLSSRRVAMACSLRAVASSSCMRRPVTSALSPSFSPRNRSALPSASPSMNLCCCSWASSCWIDAAAPARPASAFSHFGRRVLMSRRSLSLSPWTSDKASPPEAPPAPLTWACSSCSSLLSCSACSLNSFAFLSSCFSSASSSAMRLFSSMCTLARASAETWLLLRSDSRPSNLSRVSCSVSDSSLALSRVWFSWICRALTSTRASSPRARHSSSLLLACRTSTMSTEACFSRRCTVAVCTASEASALLSAFLAADSSLFERSRSSRRASICLSLLAASLSMRVRRVSTSVFHCCSLSSHPSVALSLCSRSSSSRTTWSSRRWTAAVCTASEASALCSD